MTISSAVVNIEGRGSNGSNVGIQEFLRILTAQLNNQDPLKPVDNQEFVAQIAQFTNLEQIRQLNTKTETLLQVGAANQAAALLGKRVSIVGQTATGQVSNVVFRDGTPFFDVTFSGTQIANGISLSQIQRITN